MTAVGALTVGRHPASTTAAPRAQRIAHLDVARGLSIVLVALYHSGLQPWMPHTLQALGLCRLPLFFFLAGVVFPIHRPLQRVALDRARALLLPYVLVLAVLLARAWWKGEADVFQRALGIAWGNGGTIEFIPMWFLPHLWVLSVTAALALRETGWLRWNPLAQGAALVALFAWGAECLEPEGGFSLAWHGGALALPWWPFSVDLLGVSLTFVLLGVRLRHHVGAWVPQWPWAITAAGVFLVVAVGSDAELNLNLRRMGEPLLVGAAALAGLYLLLAAAWCMARVVLLERVWSHLGRASLFVLIFHDHVDNKVQAVLAPSLGRTHPLASALLAFALCLSVPLLMRAVVVRQRFLASLFGLSPLSGR